ncbi:MAG: TetR/AcrR family transcriptional regulator [Deltaproteobacteria bacterium]|nr:TetR/AcrR family transcriptional regulator [Candidatus Zymogenaceae bacterium]
MTIETFDDLRNKEREARRELILSAALTLFAQNDFKNVTVREIAREAGVSPGTIYRYYENLDDLFIDIISVRTRELVEELGSQVEGGNPPDIQTLCQRYVTFLNDNLSFYQMMAHFMVGGRISPEAVAKLNPLMRSFLDVIEDVITFHSPDGDNRSTAQALFSALNGVMISYATYPGRTLEEVREHTVRLAGVIADRFSTSTERG